MSVFTVHTDLRGTGFNQRRSCGRKLMAPIAVVLTALLLSLPALALTVKDCFLQAEQFFEQVYCEVVAADAGASLPSFIDFKKNNQQMQALLLKRPARKLGIELPRVKSISKPKPQSKPGFVAKPSAQGSQLAGSVARATSGWAGCVLEANAINCSQARYTLVANKANRDLPAGVLEPDNRMQLPVFSGSYADDMAVQRHLLRAYPAYLRDMMTIGLGGVTMPYGKFAYFFTDLQTKGVDFNQRFATMFEYLKQDKKNNAVSTRASLPESLVLDDCYRFGDVQFGDTQFGDIVACSAERKNYLFR